MVSVNKRFVPDARPTVTGTKKVAALSLSFSFLTHMSILTMVMVTLRLVRTMLVTMMTLVMIIRRRIMTLVKMRIMMILRLTKIEADIMM